MWQGCTDGSASTALPPAPRPAYVRLLLTRLSTWQRAQLEASSMAVKNRMTCQQMNASREVLPRWSGMFVFTEVRREQTAKKLQRETETYL